VEPAAWTAALEASAFAVWMRAGYAYPVANVLHLFGMAFVVVPMLLLDLRLLGWGRRYFPLRPSASLLTRCAVLGAALAIASGVAMFASDANALAANPAMRIKLALLALALANAVAFRIAWTRRLSGFDRGLPGAARAQLLLSVALWLAIPVLGRWIAYV
jgi:hypothetical protein